MVRLFTRQADAMRILLIVLVFCLVSVPTPRAQDPAPVPTPPTGPMVGLSLIVTDKDGKGINSIRKDQIRVSEDGDEQTILSIDGDERPVDCVLLIDASGSFKTLIISALEAAKLFINNRRPDDQIAIARFVSSDVIENTQEFTADNQVLLKGLDSIYLEYGQSAVVDALYLGADYVAKHNKGNDGRRKVVVIITDGEDRNSYYSQEKLTKLLRETGVQVFILGLVVELNKEAATGTCWASWCATIAAPSSTSASRSPIAQSTRSSTPGMPWACAARDRRTSRSRSCSCPSGARSRPGPSTASRIPVRW